MHFPDAAYVLLYTPHDAVITHHAEEQRSTPSDFYSLLSSVTFNPFNKAWHFSLFRVTRTLTMLHRRIRMGHCGTLHAPPYRHRDALHLCTMHVGRRGQAQCMSVHHQNATDFRIHSTAPHSRTQHDVHDARRKPAVQPMGRTLGSGGPQPVHRRRLAAYEW